MWFFISHLQMVSVMPRISPPSSSMEYRAEMEIEKLIGDAGAGGSELRGHKLRSRQGSTVTRCFFLLDDRKLPLFSTRSPISESSSPLRI